MHPFISSLGKLTSYVVHGTGTGPILLRPDPAVFSEDVVETDKRRVFVKLHCPGTLRITTKDPNDPDFNPLNWIDVTPLGGATDGYTLYYTGDIWADGAEDVYVLSGY